MSIELLTLARTPRNTQSVGEQKIDAQKKLYIYIINNFLMCMQHTHLSPVRHTFLSGYPAYQSEIRSPENS